MSWLWQMLYTAEVPPVSSAVVMNCPVPWSDGNANGPLHVLVPSCLHREFSSFPSVKRHWLNTYMQVEEKYTRMQILCMHRLKWRKDLAAIQGKAATFARLLGVSHRY